MTRLIAIFIIVLVLFAGWRLFLYWEGLKNEEFHEKKKAAAAAMIGDQLPGLPPGLENSLQAAKQKGLQGLRNWLKTYSGSIQDPRKAWIELDYCQLLSREEPAEARRLFAAVKARTPENSPVWPRIKQLEKTYD